MSRGRFVNNLMLLWALFRFLIVFMRRHRARPSVAMAWILEVFIMGIHIRGRHDHGLAELKVLSVVLTSYNTLFTLWDLIEYMRLHPDLLRFNIAFCACAFLHGLYCLVLFNISGPIWSITIIGLVISTVECFGADLYFAAQEAFKDIHPQLTRLSPTLSIFGGGCFGTPPGIDSSRPRRTRGTEAENASGDVEAQSSRDDNGSEYGTPEEDFDGEIRRVY